MLDPEDGVAARIERHVYANLGAGLWDQEIPLPKTLPFEELVWYRLRYGFTYDHEQASAFQGIASISRICATASRPVTH